jgi:hypothetical protein
MNIEQTKITGMIAVFDNAALNARLDYSLDTSSNEVIYTISCHWKCRNVYGKCPFRNYADASLYFDGLPAVAKQELKTTA